MHRLREWEGKGREGREGGKREGRACVCEFVYEYESADQMGDMSTSIKGTVSRVACVPLPFCLVKQAIDAQSMSGPAAYRIT